MCVLRDQPSSGPGNFDGNGDGTWVGLGCHGPAIFLADPWMRCAGSSSRLAWAGPQTEVKWQAGQGKTRCCTVQDTQGSGCDTRHALVFRQGSFQGCDPNLGISRWDSARTRDLF